MHLVTIQQGFDYPCILADEKQYYLKDLLAEKEMQCNLHESLKRAQNKKLFEVRYLSIINWSLKRAQNKKLFEVRY